MPKLAMMERSKEVISSVDNMSFMDRKPAAADSQVEILEGLQKQQKTVNPKFFYDTRGSQLFEKITGLPEYYLTRTERQILSDNGAEIAQCCGEDVVVIEPGSGSSEKIRLLLDQLKPSCYVPIDIAAEFLKASALKLAKEYPWLYVQAICADFASYAQVPEDLPEGKRIVFYPGSTLGNMSPESALHFLRHIASWLDRDGGVVIGIDLHKSTHTLNNAYNDRQGVTEQFNLNVLNHLNHIADANFNKDRFSHHAFYNENKNRVEMHLVSNVDQSVNVGESVINVLKGESIHTENSYKYTEERFQQLAAQAGFALKSRWCDEQKLFGVFYLEKRQ